MKNVFLVGMPSSGKSTLGRRLARALKYRFIDLDRLIVADQKRTIPEIFGEKGEGYFRDVEQKQLRTIQPNQSLVVATGGGVPCFFHNMDYIKSTGLSVFLNVASLVLATRILNHNKDDRPLLSRIKSENLETELSKKLADRLPFYNQADITVSEQTSVQEIVALIGHLL